MPTVQLSMYSGAGDQFFDQNGLPLAGGLLYTYAATTTNPLATYTTLAGDQAHSNPIQLDAEGRVPSGGEIWLIDATSYTIVTADADGNLIGTYDHITGNASGIMSSLAGANGVTDGAVLVGFLQAGSGAVVRNSNTKMRERLTPEDFGAVGDGVADDTSAIVACLSASEALQVPASATGIYRITSTKVVFKYNADFSAATFNMYGSPAIAVEISTANADNPTTELFYVDVYLPAIINADKPATGWAGQGVGVRSVNLVSCNVWFGVVRGFATGFLESSYNTNGSVHNEYYFNHFDNCKVGHHQLPGDSTAWVNENNYYGGKFSLNSAEGTNISGARPILTGSSATHAVNNHVWYKPSLEGDGWEYHWECSGQSCQLVSARWESSSPKVLYAANTSEQAIDNIIVGGYNHAAIVFSFTGSSAFRNMLVSSKRYLATGALSANEAIFKYMNVGSSAYPIINLYEAGTKPELATVTEWSAQFGSQELNGKRKADAAARVKLDFVNGRIYFGFGTVTPTHYLGYLPVSGGLIGATATIAPTTDLGQGLGVVAYRWADTFSARFRPGAGTATWTSGAGTPEGSVTATVGSLYTNTSGGASTVLYVKETGSGNTGWIAK